MGLLSWWKASNQKPSAVRDTRTEKTSAARPNPKQKQAARLLKPARGILKRQQSPAARTKRGRPSVPATRPTGNGSLKQGVKPRNGAPPAGQRDGGRGRWRAGAPSTAAPPSPSLTHTSGTSDHTDTASGSSAPRRGLGRAHSGTPGLKRSRSLWKTRPLIIDEKLPVFVEGVDSLALLAYDNGDFYRWQKEVEAGVASAADAAPYPLIVQDSDFRTLLEIRPGGGNGCEEAGSGAGAAGAAAPGCGRPGPRPGSGIAVPRATLLPPALQPDVMLLAGEGPPIVEHRMGGEDATPGPASEAKGGRGDGGSGSASPPPAAAAAAALPPQLQRDPPYTRYVQPTPDELELAIEYDLDEEDEEWLEAHNAEARRARSRVARRTLAGEWMEHLIDRMEKEYTAELQRHPELWTLTPDPDRPDAPPSVGLPPIARIFPVERCLAVPGINHYEPVIRRVYEYWQRKHEARGAPLIQRLWYEPPWHRRRAAEAVGGDAAEGEEGEAGGEAAAHPFAESGAPSALARVRRRRLDPGEARERFAAMRRDLEAARTLADRVRKREKLKGLELELFRREHAARHAAAAAAFAGGGGGLAAGGGAGGRRQRRDALSAAAAPLYAPATLAAAPPPAPRPADDAAAHAAEADSRAARLAARRSVRHMVEVPLAALGDGQGTKGEAGRGMGGARRGASAAGGHGARRSQEAADGDEPSLSRQTPVSGASDASSSRSTDAISSSSEADSPVPGPAEAQEPGARADAAAARPRGGRSGAASSARGGGRGAGRGGARPREAPATAHRPVGNPPGKKGEAEAAAEKAPVRGGMSARVGKGAALSRKSSPADQAKDPNKPRAPSRFTRAKRSIA
ncbi:hypothetical protein ACKKBG_A20895 [Auxenochlorella protothecoides x Auxenochlorella symbiontica]